MPARSTLLALSAALACFATGCGPIERPSDAGPPRPRWVTSAEAAAAAPFRSHRDLSVLDLPQAGFPGTDTEIRGWGGFIVNVQADGSLYFKGNTWTTSPEGFGKLRTDLRKLTRDLDRRAFMLHIRADRTAPWGTVRSLIALGTTGETAMGRLRFALRARDARAGGNDAALDATVEPGPPEVSDTALRLVLETAADGGVAITVGERRLSFGTPDALSDDPAALVVTNQTWDVVDRALTAPAAGGVTAARLDGGDDVPWAYVAQTLSLLLEKGRAHVEIPGLSGRLLLVAPPATEYLDYRRMFDHDWPAGLAIGLGLLLGIGAVALPALRRRRTRAAPRPTSLPPAAA